MYHLENYTKSGWRCIPVTIIGGSIVGTFCVRVFFFFNVLGLGSTAKGALYVTKKFGSLCYEGEYHDVQI